jgi:hypothetical protein
MAFPCYSKFSVPIGRIRLPFPAVYFLMGKCCFPLSGFDQNVCDIRHLIGWYRFFNRRIWKMAGARRDRTARTGLYATVT